MQKFDERKAQKICMFIYGLKGAYLKIPSKMEGGKVLALAPHVYHEAHGIPHVYHEEGEADGGRA